MILPLKTDNPTEVSRVCAFNQDRFLWWQTGKPHIFPKITSELPLTKRKAWQATITTIKSTEVCLIITGICNVK